MYGKNMTLRGGRMQKLLLGLLDILGNIYYSTWFVWPFVFVFSLLNAVRWASKDKEEEKSVGAAVMAGVSLLIILAGV